jgi:hypothetical protein
MNKRESEYVKKRKSYYGFAKNYPGKLGANKYVIGDSLDVRRRETINKIIMAILVVLLFVVTFVVTTVCLEISEKPVNESTQVKISQIQQIKN